MMRKPVERRPEKARQLATDRDVADQLTDTLAALGGISKKRERNAIRVAEKISATAIIPEPKIVPYVPPTWDEHMATISARRAALADRTSATATEAEPAPDEPPEERKPRKRRPAGLIGLVNPGLYDFDDDDWN